MKQTRKFASIATAAVLAACAVVPTMTSMSAFAADPSATITFTQADVNDTAEHTYVAYQIFTGSGVNDSGALQNPVYAITDAQASALIAALKGLNVKVSNPDFDDTKDEDPTTNPKTIDPFASLSAGTLNAETGKYDGMSTAPALAEALSLVPTLEVKAETEADPSTYTADAKAAASLVADAIAKLATDATSGWTEVATSTTVSGVTTLNVSSTGYYLFVEGSLTDGVLDVDTTKQGAVTKHILRTVPVNEDETVTTDNIEITVKSGLPSVIKKVQENTKDVDGYDGTDLSALQEAVDSTNKWNDVADYNIGDAVPFELIGSLPERYADYEHYYYCFNDTLCSGFKVPDAAKDFKVVVVNENTETNITTETDITNETGVNITSEEVTNDNGTADDTTDDYKEIAITVEITDLTALTDADDKALVTADSLIKVTYSATLDTDAVIGLDGNENGVTLTYSNNPNQTGDGSDSPTGTTPEDKVIVFTYELDNTKVDSNDEPVKDAVFVLYREVTKEGTATKEYVLINSDNTVAGWTTNKPTVGSDGTITDSTDASKVVGKETTAVLTSGEDGKFIVKGLDDGTYKVEEIKAPDGYNKLTNPVTMEIAATTANDQKWDTFDASDALTKLELTVTTGDSNDSASVDTGDVHYNTTNKDFQVDSFTVTGADNTSVTYTGGVVAAKIVNTSGAILPSTGGIGTTIFYVAGGVLVVGAGVLLITKKRAKDAE